MPALTARSATLPIGLQVGASAIHAVQFAHKGRQQVLHASALVPLPPEEERTEEALANAFGQLADSAPWSGRQVAVAIPPAEVDIRPVRLPEGIVPDRSPRFRGALLAEARAALLYDPRDAVIDFLSLPKSETAEEGPEHVLLIATRKERINRYLAAMSAARLRCLRVDIAPCAAVRALAPQDEATLLVDLQSHCTQVSVFAGEDVLFSRMVKHGLDGAAARLASETGMSDTACLQMLSHMGIDHEASRVVDNRDLEETGKLDNSTMAAMAYEATLKEWGQLVHEIQRTADYFALQPFGGAVTGVRIIGEMVPPGLDRLIAARMRVPAEIGLLSAACKAAMNGTGCANAVAAGLAMPKVKNAIRN